MAGVLCVVLLLITGFGCGSCERSTQCYESCVAKVCGHSLESTNEMFYMFMLTMPERAN